MKRDLSGGFQGTMSDRVTPRFSTQGAILPGSCATGRTGVRSNSLSTSALIALWYFENEAEAEAETPPNEFDSLGMVSSMGGESLSVPSTSFRREIRHAPPTVAVSVRRFTCSAIGGRS